MRALRLRTTAIARLALAAPLLGAAPFAAAQSPSTVNADEDETRPLDALLVATPDEDLSRTAVATRLLEAGPDETARFLRSFEAYALRLQREGRPVERIARLGASLRETPAAIADVIGRPEVPRAARIDATAVALEVLRRDPTARSLSTLTSILEQTGTVGAEGAARIRPGLLDAVEQFATAKVGDDRSIGRLYEASAPLLSVTVVDGLAGSDEGDFALERLAALLGRIPSVDGAVLNRIHIVAEQQPVYADARTRDRIADYLDDERPFARHEAAAALGTLGDRETVAALIWLLEDPAPSVREAAHRSLRTLTSMTIAGDPVRWRLWLERQEAWWDERGEALVARIPVAERGELLDVLRETCTKRLYHREIAPALLTLLERSDVDSIEIGLSAVGTLRAPSALPVVRELTTHPDPLVRRRAAAALRSYRHANVSTAFTGPLRLTGADD